MTGLLKRGDRNEKIQHEKPSFVADNIIFFIGLTMNRARADVRVNIGLGYPISYIEHHHRGYVVQHHVPRYSYHRHYYHQPNKFYSNHKQLFHQQKNIIQKISIIRNLTVDKAIIETIIGMNPEEIITSTVIAITGIIAKTDIQNIQ